MNGPHANVERLTSRRYAEFTFTSGLSPDITHCAMDQAMQEGRQVVIDDSAT